MPRSKKSRNKKRWYQPTGKQSIATQPWKAHLTFEPIESILDQLEQDGTLTVIDKGPQAGMPIFKINGDTEWQASVPALRGLIEFFEVHEMRTGICLPLEPMRQLAAKMQYDSPIFESDTRTVRDSIKTLRSTVNSLNKDYAIDLLQVTQISEQFDRVLLKGDLAC